ncbi:hypothetical protein [Jeotgalibacillus campisalis]|uniref:Uncharacterized protein n=1 Tax=Jeotgalibacillus campisalis TaxID=220754 RepID=A0A0C2VGR0_9BACL|nr:hypothetical protein [Jeotgalibacillus campisalis]KIL43706.1 hypothetical protein KR50_32260 [Jeotgalibacillus campisalis]
MEKAMQSSHGVGYETYMTQHEVRMEVEMKREEDYKKSQELIAELDSKLHNHL